MATGAADARISALALAFALAVHGVAIGALSRMQNPREDPRPDPVEFELREPPPPLPEIIPAPEPPPAPEPVKPRLVVQRTAPPPRPVAPPPPNQTPPPDTPPPSAPPVFGVTMSSVVAGDSAVAVPVGNTLMMKPPPARKMAEAPLAYAAGTQPGEPVPEVQVTTLPERLYEVNSADIYPSDAKALGIEGKVRASLTLNEKGTVVGVRILERAGHGFDEAAAQALRKFRFSPARTSDGRAVPYRMTYEMKFSIVD